MKGKSNISVMTLLIPVFLLLLPLSSGAAPPGTIVEGDYLDVSKQTWREYHEPIGDPLGHPQLPWLPKEEYPFKQPYTGTELTYLAKGEHYDRFGAKYQEAAVISSTLNKRGLLIQRRIMGAFETLYDHYKDVYYYDLDKEGKVGTHGLMFRLYAIFDTPADLRGTQQIKLVYLNSPAKPWKIADIWNYIPGLRRVTRSQGGDRQDETLGTPITNDDLGDRQIWEEDHLLIGEDVLYMQNLDPQIIAPQRSENTGDMKKDGEWIKQNMDPSRGEEVMNPYRPDGGIECWVVLSKWAERRENPPYGSTIYKDPKEYYLKYQISWIEKVTKTAIRVEQYDHDNRLIKFGNEWNPEIHAGGFINGGTSRTQMYTYDLRRHFRSSQQLEDMYTGPKAKLPEDKYTPDQLLKEQLYREWTVKPMWLKNAKEYVPCPALYRAKFPKYRAGTQDWLTKDDMEIITQSWKNHGFSDEEIEAMIYGEGVVRKNGKVMPVRKHERPACIHRKPLPVKFPNE